MTKKNSAIKQILLVVLASVITLVIGVIGSLPRAFADLLKNAGPLLQSAFPYYSFIFMWIICVVYLLINKKDRPILNVIGNKPLGNSLKFIFIGLGIGAALNFLCAGCAILSGDISLTLSVVNIPSLLIMFVGVFIQCSAEELICRGFLYQKILKITGKPVLAILLNPIVFAAGHLFNPGVTPLAILNIVLFGIMLSVMVYYMDSLWAAFAVHTAWNFMQSCIFGLPNSGFVFPVSLFKNDMASAKDSIFYNVSFGVEGTVIACVTFAAVAAVICFWGRKSGKARFNVWDNKFVSSQQEDSGEA